LIWGLLAACGSDDRSGNGAVPMSDLGSGNGLVDLGGSPPDLGGVDAGARPDMAVSFGPEQCDAVIEADCFLPYPSNLPIVVDPTTPTGFGLTYFPDAFPVSADEVSFQGDALGFLDGVPLDISILTAFEDLDPRGLPGENQIEASLDTDASILLFRVNLDTLELERVPYWAEVDPRAPDGEPSVLFVRPARLLQPGSRYIVAFRGLRTGDGSFVPRSPGFEALVEGTTAGTEIADRQPGFDDLLALLDAAEVDIGTLQAAWDFRTVTRDRQLFLTDAVLEAFRQWRDGTELRYTPFLAVDERPIADQTLFPPESPWAIQFDGTMVVPEFLADTGIDGVPARGFPDPRQPQVLGEREVPFRIRIAKSALAEEGNEAAPILILGHPLGGSRDYLDAPEWARLAERRPLILAIVDWPGLSAAEAPLFELSLSNINAFRFIAEGALQGWVEQLVFAEVAQAFISDPLLQGELNVEPEDLGFVGVGLGGSLGAGLVAASPLLDRGVLVSAPADIGLAFSRGAAFTPLLLGPDGLVEGYALQSRAWIMTEVIRSFLSPLSNATLFSQLEAPDGDFVGGRVLWTAALSDARVSHLDMERMARSERIPLMANYPRSAYEVTPAAYPRSGSGSIVFDLGSGFPPPRAEPPAEPVGSELLDLEAHTSALFDFVRTGTISDPCGGAPCRF